jgi:flagellar motor switch/type III secretory pathway protein FliN
MKVVDVEPTDLPRVTARDARALTRAARVLSTWPARLEAPLGEVGHVAVAREGVEVLSQAVARDAGSDVVLGLTRACGAGRLVLDGVLARRLAAVALGAVARPEAPHRRLGLAERGVVAGLVAGALHAFGAPCSVSLVAPGGAALVSEGGVAIALAVTVGAIAGWARIELPESWLAIEPASASHAVLGALDLEARVELGRTRLLGAELADLGLGDAVVFDGEPALACADGGSRSVRVLVGSFAARARLDRIDQLEDGGRVTLEERLGPAALDAGGGLLDEHRREEIGMDRQEGDGTATREIDAAAVLAAAPIEVVAELGRVVLRGDELAGLGPGAVLTLGRVGASPVALRVGGEIWAEGELVDVEGELGVRVTALRRPGPR